MTAYKLTFYQPDAASDAKHLEIPLPEGVDQDAAEQLLRDLAARLEPQYMDLRLERQDRKGWTMASIARTMGKRQYDEEELKKIVNDLLKEEQSCSTDL